MNCSLILAASAGEVIGDRGELPWHLAGDLRRFRALTAGHAVVMGRVTHESIVRRLGHPLPGRTSIVLSRSPAAGDGGRVIWVASLAAALETAGQIASADGGDEFFVAGGAEVYRQALPAATRVYLTRVHRDVPGDRRMPPGWLDGFLLRSRADHADDTTGTCYSFLHYQRAAT